MSQTLGHLDVVGAFAPGMVAVIFVFFFLAVLDSVGTLVGVKESPLLILVGTMMLGGLRYIDWSNVTEAIPSFLTFIMMPLGGRPQGRNQ